MCIPNNVLLQEEKHMGSTERMLTQKEVCESLGVGRTWLWRAEVNGLYPRGIRYTKRCVRYSARLHEQFVRGQLQGAANDE
jgi:predicted DNA-binding transcriptional regulator AlpA